ncbi:LCP family protein [Thermoanaerobacter brockii subsp. lactiethylicus]|jgi:LCP family protein required for cell wall assembly|uniref:Cell envelope-related transcriptional attenuator n=2 Tax=Thermoanaerobacter TaxID=1754 RepID=B0KAR3_THEP3|nr:MULTISPECIES: LCP family protein [Thermoanaerobacter]KUJ90121.1 MAG: cell envelope-related transcriptional attenuator [Thermoanaerobacter thermocopriae]ABY93502.1 cell envelope-related transcriptional attenuator [Thermoanaerobacter sp. X514]ABY95197.1 cell envelope-related transcriptional attenuator [Thermoanaerobacter pseudethanolicus ATCC 33223]ADV80148.1 cell envelope-related function transcriptional attenuator, LytR/CpsA family [Thermoanaerobacter brockii subsp. finnii Ako-1]MBZ4656640.
MKRKKWFIFFLILSIVASGAFFVYYKYIRITKHPESVFNNDNKNNISNSEQALPKDKVYIAFLGLDKNDERVHTLGSFRTDTIMIFSIDLNDKVVKVLSIPRDTYVDIPGFHKDKINAAYVYGGMGEKGYALSLKTISDFLGIDVPYYISIDMQTIPDIVDAIGGVPLDVEVNMHSHGANLDKGYQILDGQKAYQYLRWRYDPMGDINRIKRQQKFIIAFANQLKSKAKDVSTYINLYNTFKGKLYTNLNYEQILALIYAVKDISPDSIEKFTVPGDFYDLNGISYWKPDMEKLNEVLQEFTK